jgi:glyceraldehyde 3-phosphate dehydrogenase
VNAVFAGASDAGPLARVLEYATDPLVSRDVVGNAASCVFDAGLTQVNEDFAKVFGWYDNEWGYANRLADITEYVGSRL